VPTRRTTREQKNGGVTRRLVGYGRFDGVSIQARLHVNLFQPSFKLKEKCYLGFKA
jgi:hypothetical protein